MAPLGGKISETLIHNHLYKKITLWAAYVNRAPKILAILSAGFFRVFSDT